MSTENAELQEAKHLKCERCHRHLSRIDSSVEFYSCNNPDPEHRPYLVSAKFDTETGEVTLSPMVKRKVPLAERIKRKLRSYLV